MYDAIIIGNDFASLTAALVLAHSGGEALWLREGDIPDAYIESGYTFNLDPFPWSGFDPQGMVGDFLSGLDAPLFEQSSMYPLNPSFQVIIPDHRIDFSSNLESQLNELRREFPVEVDRIIKFYDTATKKRAVINKMIDEKVSLNPYTFLEYVKSLLNIPARIWHKKVLLKKYEDFLHNSSFKKILEAETLLFSNLYPDTISFLSLSYTVDRSFKPLYYYMGGKHNFINELKQIFSKMGGNIIDKCSILRLNIKDTIHVDITIDGESFSVKGKNVILSAKWEKLKPCLLKDKRFSKLVGKYTAFEKSVYPFTIHTGVSDKGIPEKMAEHVILIADEEKFLTNGNLVFLETSVREDTLRAPLGKRALSASVFLNDSPTRLGDGELKDISGVILKNIEDFLPFFGENLDFINIERSIQISRQYQEVVNRKYVPGRHVTFGISPLSNRTPVKNVFLTGGMILPDLGFEGEILSGIHAANFITGGG